MICPETGGLGDVLQLTFGRYAKGMADIARQLWPVERVEMQVVLSLIHI